MQLFLGYSISISTIFYTLWRYSPELPSYESIVNYKPNLSSRIYSSDGLLLKSFYTEERIFIPENRIPENIKLALVLPQDHPPHLAFVDESIKNGTKHRDGSESVYDHDTFGNIIERIKYEKSRKK